MVINNILISVINIHDGMIPFLVDEIGFKNLAKVLFTVSVIVFG